MEGWVGAGEGVFLLIGALTLANNFDLFHITLANNFDLFHITPAAMKDFDKLAS